MSFPAYESYKETGIEWLREVPTHWDLSRLGFEAWVRARLGWKGLKAEEYVDAGYIFLATPNIKGRRIDFENVNYITRKRYEESPEIKLRVGDVLLAKDGSTLGTVNVVRRLPSEATVNSSLAVITPHARLDSLFLFYLFQSSYIEHTIQLLKGGMGVPHLFQDDLNKFAIPIPPLSEQAEIVAFLERETAKIDALVSEQQRLIELLKEKRQTVVSHAVTKGLDPQAPMKDSGVVWLGEVPEHWSVAPLKRFVSVLSGFAFPSDGFSSDLLDTRLLRGVNIGVGSVRWEDVVYWSRREGDQLEDWELRVGDVVLGMDRPWIADGVRVARLTDEDVPCLLLQRVASLRPSEHLLPDYLVHLLEGNAFYHHCIPEMTGVSVPHISSGQIGDFLVAMPPIDEQARILEHANELAAGVKSLTAATQTAIDLLRERRSAVVSAAVTGKIDVRRFVEADTPVLEVVAA